MNLPWSSPANTVDIRREGPRVAVVSPDNKVNYRLVKLGRDFGKTIEIVEWTARR